MPELIINENQSIVSEHSREDDIVANVKKANERDNYNGESFISDQSKDPDIKVKIMQTKKKKKKKKRKQKKKNSGVNISENNKHRCEHGKIDIPQKDNSSNKTNSSPLF